MDLRVGDQFTSWSDFMAALDRYSRTTNTVWTVLKSRSVQAANNRLEKPPYYTDQLVNAYARIGCKHYGSCRSLATGQRTNQRLAERLCNPECTAGHSGVHQRAAKEKCSNLKRCLTNIKTKTKLLQALENDQEPQSDHGLRAVEKEINAVKKQGQALRDAIEDKAFALEENLNPNDLAQYLQLKNEVSEKIAEIRTVSAQLGVEVQGSGNDDWDWQSQHLLNNYELKAEEQSVKQLEEFVQNKEMKNKELEAEMKALQEELNKRNNLAACPSSQTEWYGDTIAIMRDLSGIDDIRVGNQELHITFSNTEERQNAEKLQLAVFFNIGNKGGVFVAGAECNVTELDLSEIISHSINNNDYVYLVTNVKIVWKGYESLYHEVRSLQERYPVDWLMNERRLRLLCKTTAKILCVLEVAFSYPSLGAISFVQVEGSQHDVISHHAQKLQSPKLTDWVEYCYSCFTNAS